MIEWWNADLATWQRIAGAFALAALVSYVMAEFAARLARVWLVRALQGHAAPRFADPIVRSPIRVTRSVAFLASLVLVAPAALQVSGIALPDYLDDGLGFQRVVQSGPRVLVLALVAYLLMRGIAIGTARWEQLLGQDTQIGEVERAKRARTVGSLVRNALTAIVLALASLSILREFGVDIMPVVTGAGILGLAVGFGAQTLVRDVISGFFLIFENHLRVGDVAEIEGAGGLVESINLRTTVLRDLEGTVHVLPNGSFSRFANRTKGFSYYLIDVGVAYKEDTDRVSAVLREVAENLQTHPAYGPSILAPLEVLGVDGFGDSQVTIKVRIKTVPLKQWEVGRELRRRIKQAFDREGIEIPFPHLSVYFGEASRPWRFESLDRRLGSSPQPAEGHSASLPGGQS